MSAMLSMPIGPEIGNINGAIVHAIPLTRAIMLLGYELTISIGFSEANLRLANGDYEQVLVIGHILSGLPTMTQGPDGTYYLSGPFIPSSDAGPSTFINPQNFSVNPGSGGRYGQFFASIIKTTEPTNQTFCMNLGDGIAAPAGSYIAFYFGAGPVKADAELQGALYYK